MIIIYSEIPICSAEYSLNYPLYFQNKKSNNFAMSAGVLNQITTSHLHFFFNYSHKIEMEMCIIFEKNSSTHLDVPK